MVPHLFLELFPLFNCQNILHGLLYGLDKSE